MIQRNVKSPVTKRYLCQSCLRQYSETQLDPPVPRSYIVGINGELPVKVFDGVYLWPSNKTICYSCYLGRGHSGDLEISLWKKFVDLLIEGRILTRKQGEYLWLRVYKGFTHKEIAEKFNCLVGSIEKLAKRTQKRLRNLEKNEKNIRKMGGCAQYLYRGVALSKAKEAFLTAIDYSEELMDREGCATREAFGNIFCTHANSSMICRE